MKAEILRRIPLPGIPSGSGLEIVNGLSYIIGDDSPYLYVLDAAFRQIRAIELFATEDFASGRIPKHLKPDLECLASITLDGQPYLLSLGSGSTPNREKGYLVPLVEGLPIREIPLTALYALLRTECFSNGRPLNIEGLALGPETAYLLNRTNNAVYSFSLAAFQAFLTSAAVPEPTVHRCALPLQQGVPSGFTGASYFDGHLFFTAAAEDTNDPVKDGPVLGSFVGCLALPGMQLAGYAQIQEGSAFYGGKTESLVVYSRWNGRYLALAVTDDDAGGSELLQMTLEV